MYIRGVTVHKFTVRYVFDTGGGEIDYRNVGNVFVLNHECDPMDITQARVWTRLCILQTKCKIYAGEHLNLRNNKTAGYNDIAYIIY